MRTDKERIDAMHARAAELDRERRNKKVQVIRAVSVAACLIFVIGLAVFMSGIHGQAPEGGAPDTMIASVFSGSGIMGFIFIGVIAFVLGVTVTVLCYNIKAGRSADDKENGQ